MAMPTTNLWKDGAFFRNAERETRRLASEGCVINDIVDGFSRVVDKRNPPKIPYEVIPKSG